MSGIQREAWEKGNILSTLSNCGSLVEEYSRDELFCWLIEESLPDISSQMVQPSGSQTLVQIRIN